MYIPYEIQKIDHIPAPLDFLRNWVNPNVPVVIKGGASDWIALKMWTFEYLKQTLKDKPVTVAVTPNGFADAIAFNQEENKEMFVLPEERTLTISELFERLESVNSGNRYDIVWDLN